MSAESRRSGQLEASLGGATRQSRARHPAQPSFFEHPDGAPPRGDLPRLLCLRCHSLPLRAPPTGHLLVAVHLRPGDRGKGDTAMSSSRNWWDPPSWLLQRHFN